MEESIDMRVTSDYWIKIDHSGYDFLRRYEAELRTSEKEEWGSEELSRGHGRTLPATVKGSLEQIAHSTLLFEHYNKMTHPSYNILLWEGHYPMSYHKKHHTGLLTKVPRKYVVDRLTRLFDEYYQIENLLQEKHYEEAYDMVSKAKMGWAFMCNLEDNRQMKKFYIELRKRDKNKAFKMVRKFFPLERYFEFETDYLHQLEGDTLDEKFKTERIKIHYSI